MNMILSASPSNDSENLVFGLILIALVIALVVLIINLVKRNRSGDSEEGSSAATHYVPTPSSSSTTWSDKKKPAEAKKSVELMGSLAKGKSIPAVPVRVHTDARDRKTIDEHYADIHGQWKCPYCETLNGDDLSVCVACGQPRG